MKTIRNILESKKRDCSIGPRQTVATALQKMADQNLGALLVIENNELIGIFSERDYARKLLLEGRSSLTTEVREVMVNKVHYVTPEFDLHDCLQILLAKSIRHLPVLEDGRVLGLLDLEDVASHLLEGQEHLIAQLDSFITGSPVMERKFFKPQTVREFLVYPATAS